MTEFRENTTPLYPGHVPPKDRSEWAIPMCMVMVGLITGATLTSMFLPGATETVTHIDQPAATCGAAQ